MLWAWCVLSTQQQLGMGGHLPALRRPFLCCEMESWPKSQARSVVLMGAHSSEKMQWTVFLSLKIPY